MVVANERDEQALGRALIIIEQISYLIQVGCLHLI